MGVGRPLLLSSWIFWVATVQGGTDFWFGLINSSPGSSLRSRTILHWKPQRNLLLSILRIFIFFEAVACLAYKQFFVSINEVSI